MEQEALRRVQEMHSGARPPKRTQAVNTPSVQRQQNPPQKEGEEKFSEEPPKKESEAPLLNSLFADKEKLLILILILVLSSEDNSDPALTLALLYLII